MRFETIVREVIQRTRDVSSIRFDRPIGFDFLPGQFIFVMLDVGGKRMEKHFTISSSPTEPKHIEITKRFTGHEFSLALAALSVGDKVEINGPRGGFSFTGEYDKILLLTGGIGITPFRCIIRYCIDKGLSTDIVLLYSSGSEADIVFQGELEEMQSAYGRLRVVHTLTHPSYSWRGYRGRINEEIIREVAPDYSNRVCYVSGPPNMVDRIASILIEELNIPRDKVIRDVFFGY
jgi:glycine betaine catabolism B